MPKKYRVPGTAMLFRWWTGPPVVVIVPNPPEPAIQICTSKARGGELQAWHPMGPIEVRQLTKAEERFLLSKGMHPDLFGGQRVFAVSNEAANRFDTGLKTFTEVAEQCGLSRGDLSRIAEAKKNLIWGSDRAKYGAPETKYKDARVCVTGKITSFRGKPEVIATEPNQIVQQK